MSASTGPTDRPSQGSNEGSSEGLGDGLGPAGDARTARAARLSELQDAHDAAGAQDGGEDLAGGKLKPLYPHVEPWVRGVFAATYVRRTTSTFRWCAQWWRHPEAIVRLEALWRSWEILRLDPTTGLGVWFRDHLDHQLPVLTGPDGPFADCAPTLHHEPEDPALLVEPAPPGWWGSLPPAA